MYGLLLNCKGSYTLSAVRSKGYNGQIDYVEYAAITTYTCHFNFFCTNNHTPTPTAMTYHYVLRETANLNLYMYM